MQIEWVADFKLLGPHNRWMTKPICDIVVLERLAQSY